MKNGKKGVYLKNYDSICKPISEGGLGLQNMEHFNLAMIAKMGWRLKENPITLCATNIILVVIFYMLIINLNKKIAGFGKEF